MVFSSAVFLLLFLPVVFVLNYFVKKEYSNMLLLIASLIFYAWGEPIMVLLMMISILINWIVGWILSVTEPMTPCWESWGRWTRGTVH